MEAELLLALDGGGTKTQAILADRSGHVLGLGRSGPSNPLSVGNGEAVNNVLAAARMALGGHDVRETAAIGLYIPGFGRCQGEMPEAYAKARVWSDAYSAYYACLGKAGGVVVLAGTGSFALGIDETGAAYTAGGWGHLLGDEGSGYDIGRRALRALLRRDEAGARPTDLDLQLMAALQIDKPRGALRAVYAPGAERGRIAALCPLVARAARAGAEDACAILEEAAGALGELAAQVAAQMAPGPRDAALTGGVAQMGAPIRTPFERRLGAVCPQLRLTMPRFSPATGAMLHLMRENGCPVADAGERIEAELRNMPEGNRHADGYIF